ncbi:MAG: hypothetical protein P4L63_00970 [Candidatus Pacebacteria bacterium]|nr:hypothetical protein [Candidatus Paceibacterota bacterium]
MKYKKHIATGVLAFSLLISGTNVFAATPQDLGIKSTSHAYQKTTKTSKITLTKNKTVGVVGSISGLGFTLEVKNLKNKTSSSIDVNTNSATNYSKNGITVTASDLMTGQKVIVVGTLDKTTNIITAKTVKIASN